MKQNLKIIVSAIAPIAFASGGYSLITTSCSKKDDVESKFFTVKGQDLTVTFCDRGASIYSIKYKDLEITYQPQDKKTFLRNDLYYGKALGRVAGRIKDGKIKVTGKDYSLPVNEKSKTKNNSLHGGTDSFSTKDFDRKVEETQKETKVTFTCISPAYESGYPEEVTAIYEYTLNKYNNILKLDITATSTGTTPVNLSNCPYFRLDNVGDIRNHELTIDWATQLARYDDQGGQTVVDLYPDIKQTPWDFSLLSKRRIGQDIENVATLDPVSNGYDHIWKFNTDNRENIFELCNPIRNNLCVYITTDADSVLINTDCYPLEDVKMCSTGEADHIYNAISFSPMTYYTTDNTDILNISPGHPFKRTITYDIHEK